MVRWNPALIEHWAFRAQLMAVGLLGLAVLMPFVMLPAFVALVVTAIVLGPRNLLSLTRKRATGRREDRRDDR